jgi:dolichol-phosphate mannosyltransferase
MRHWLRFNFVGIIGFGLQSVVLVLLSRQAPGLSYLVATALAVELAVLNNFIWHQRWTWNDRPSRTKSETLRRFAKFNLTSGVVSLTGNLFFMSLLVGRFHLSISLANLASVLACSLLSFLLADWFAFGVDTATA